MNLTVDAAPWWYVAALAGGFTILGGLITWLSALITEATKAKRERRYKWDERVIEHVTKAVTYAADFDDEIKAANARFSDEIRQGEKLRAAGESPGLLSHYSTEYVSYELLRRECAAVALVAHWRVKSAAERLASQAMITKGAWGFPKHGGEPHSVRMQPLREAVENLQASVRKYVGV